MSAPSDAHSEAHLRLDWRQDGLSGILATECQHHAFAFQFSGNVGPVRFLHTLPDGRPGQITGARSCYLLNSRVGSDRQSGMPVWCDR